VGKGDDTKFETVNIRIVAEVETSKAKCAESDWNVCLAGNVLWWVEKKWTRAAPGEKGFGERGGAKSRTGEWKAFRPFSGLVKTGVGGCTEKSFEHALC